MPEINPYLTFDGNCMEAFSYYKSVFGGDFEDLSPFSDLPPDVPSSPEDADKLMHVSLPLGEGQVLMGSDRSSMMGTGSLGNNVAISIAPESSKEGRRVFDALADGGEVDVAELYFLTTARPHGLPVVLPEAVLLVAEQGHHVVAHGDLAATGERNRYPTLLEVLAPSGLRHDIAEGQSRTLDVTHRYARRVRGTIVRQGHREDDLSADAGRAVRSGRRAYGSDSRARRR